ncbi:hypothetical protein [Paenibacillus bovis]|uniref:Uncharacterized protein n=1 Tax=Paenibacillus bovis TaxID=1616788 RepID=A0A172ZED7_9BACL|nr:hypothetical protein [Paenibacillus bovis]ANF95520.1 hypothetical protein AR543_05520 [Paenibacillus bovis]
MPSSDELERELSERLTEGQMQEEERDSRERRMIPPKYEVRIQTENDPIVEETLQYRKMAKELDGRYDDYLNKAKRPDPEGEE